ncbi:helix-turn-helix domain-containing protein [Vibrio penaeicida]|uniref:winged helix-turn-helix transcriptional regulator n=1 Tax=Vibrio penaeicida TaxID=104609 RepID=UPI0027363DD6|nr:helix-turn-helix domain-containing protein [Vibrio penaeicida]MDP2574561.1 helix-turn-helix domain-containing protein [Vibrio penaeicida]
MKNKEKDFYCRPYGCSVQATLSVIGGRWKPVILFHLMEGSVLRFGELKLKINTITQRMLTSQLRELEADGIIARKVYPEVPPKVEYKLTEYGLSLKPILNGMREWGANHIKHVGLAEEK